jgi:hypothetical protein
MSRFLILSPSTSRIVDEAPALLIFLKHPNRLSPAHIPSQVDPSFLQSTRPILRLGPFVESKRLGIFGPCSTNQASNPGQGNRTETHGTGLTTGHQLMRRHAGSTEIEAPDLLLGIGQRHHFRMGMGAIRHGDKVDSDSNERARLRFKYGSAKRSSTTLLHIRQG